MTTFNSSRLLYCLCIAFSISLIFVNFSSCSDSLVYGCTDPSSTSYDPNANENDFSCIYLRDRFIGRYRGSINATDDFFDDDDATLRISPKANTNSEVIVSISIRNSTGDAEVSVREGQIDINFINEEASMRFCSPAGWPWETGSLHILASLIFSPDNNTVTITGASHKGTYGDFNCTVLYDAEYTRI